LSKSNVFRVFPNDPIPETVSHALGPYIYTTGGRKILDTSAGGTSYAILGWSHPKVLEAIQKQSQKFTHMDYKIWSDVNVELLASLLVSKSNHGLNKVYFSGNSGAEACEAAMKMSYQVHYDQGYKNKKWFISRNQSYHGSTSDALALGERPNLEFFREMLSPFRARIPMHHPLYLKKEDETLDDYAKRSAYQLEEKILEIGPQNVSGFVGETIMGGLVGDVPPAPNYWKYIRDVCSRYGVHLILDEVYCGTGTSGKIYCCDWDNVRPDFIFIGKTLAAGYGVLSAVITDANVEEIIKKGQGRLQHTTTHQAHSLSVSAALSVQEIIHDDQFLEKVRSDGEYMRNTLEAELKSCGQFREVRGRGMRFSVEHSSSSNELFSASISENMLEKHSILVNSKWHRTCFTPSLLLDRKEIDFILDAYIREFKLTSLKIPSNNE
jgi:adenosylmethionine-8-amino-7-oxononanoate aminotransferase